MIKLFHYCSIQKITHKKLIMDIVVLHESWGPMSMSVGILSVGGYVCMQSLGYPKILINRGVQFRSAVM